MSRNPDILVELLLDLLPLNQCFLARDRVPPRQLTEAILRLQAMVRFLRLGDGMLARFNGVGAPAAAAIGTIIAYGDSGVPPPSEARASGYVRLARGATIMIADVGSPPPPAVGGETQAGCLSFEMSAGRYLLFVNCGMPGGSAADWVPAARATANHNALCLAEQSTGKLVLQQREGISALSLRQPDNIDWHLEDAAGGIVLHASHDGYERRTGLLHERRLILAADGSRLDGYDRVHGGKRGLRLKQDVPFAAHFHLHPDVGSRMGASGEVLLTLPDGEGWRFSVQGAAITVEESMFFAGNSGPRAAMQIVLRGATFGNSEINWTVERVHEGPAV